MRCAVTNPRCPVRGSSRRMKTMRYVCGPTLGYQLDHRRQSSLSAAHSSPHRDPERREIQRRHSPKERVGIADGA